jgi:hypothetical protein
MKKAKVALACKLAVILHRMLVDGTPFAADKAAMVKAEQAKGVFEFGKRKTPSARSEVPSPGRWIRQAEKCSVASKDDHAFLDRPTCPSPYPIR